jgi:thymidylate synthase
VNFVGDIRKMFIDGFNPTLPMNELVGESFIANEPSIFMEPNEEYIQRELQWYESQSLSVHDFPGGAPTIWKNVASLDGKINSNYGYLLFSKENGRQFTHVLDQLLKEGEWGRRATAVYTRPSIHEDYNVNGMQDFICTNAVCYFLRDGQIHAVVQMRSNDFVYGYRNDFAWQKFVLDRMVLEYNHFARLRKIPEVSAGDIHWSAASLHIYPRHYSVIMKDVLQKLLKDYPNGINGS